MHGNSAGHRIPLLFCAGGNRSTGSRQERRDPTVECNRVGVGHGRAAGKDPCGPATVQEDQAATVIMASKHNTAVVAKRRAAFHVPARRGSGYASF